MFMKGRGTRADGIAERIRRGEMICCWGLFGGGAKLSSFQGSSRVLKKRLSSRWGG